MKTKTIISLALFLFMTVAPGCVLRERPTKDPTPVSPLIVPSPEIPLPPIPSPPPIPQPQLDPTPGQPAPNFMTPDSSPTSPAPDVSPGKVTE